MSFMETRGMLAKCLATENLIIEHDPNAETAAFSTQERILKLPVLETASEYVYNMFVGHEVGHALETPTDWFKTVPEDIPFDFINVIEDVRIEEFIQNKYPGLRKDFHKGYTELIELDFFDLAGKDPNKLSFIDRVNIHFKLGERAFMPFSDDERPLLNQIGRCETWENVVQAAKDLCAFLKAKQQDQEYFNDNDMENKDGDGNTKGKGDNGKEGKNGNVGKPELNADGSLKMGSGSINSSDFEETSITQRAFDESLKKLAEDGKRNTGNIRYVNSPKCGVDEVVIPIETIRQQFIETRKAIIDNAIAQDTVNTAMNRIREVEQEFTDYLFSIKSDVNYMVQQFEMKKSADAYARQQIHKTGVLNTSKLHQYKITEDLFLSQTVLPNGKNHGLVMFLDWSGSMSGVAKDTVKQILLMVQFCRKAQIPFEVYTFTSGQYHHDNNTWEKLAHDKQIAMTNCHLVRILSSENSKAQLETDMLNIYCQACAGSYSRSIPCSRFLSYNGTPLDNLLFLVPNIIDRFRKLTNAQVVSFVCLTDGASNNLQWHEKVTREDGSERLQMQGSYTYESDKIVVRDGINAIPLKCTNDIVQWLNRKLDDVSITNIYIGQISSIKNYCTLCGVQQPQPLKFKKTNGYIVECPKSWPLLICMNPSNFSAKSDELEVGDNASKGAIVSALRKFLKGKNGSKQILSSLVGQFS